jgi:hypothetical protein
LPSGGAASFRQAPSSLPQFGETLVAELDPLPDAAVAANGLGLGLGGKAIEKERALIVAIVYELGE